MFSHMFHYFRRYFLFLVFSQNCYSLISLRLFRLHGIQFLVPFSRTFDTLSQYVVHAPLYFWHRTRGFLEAKHQWEPGSRLTTGDLSPFRLLARVSGMNLHLANANHTFLTQKNPQTDTFLCDISPAKLCSTARVRNPQGISKLVNKVDCHLSYDSFLALCSKRQCGRVLLRNPLQRVCQRTPAKWHASQTQSRKTSYL